MSEWHEWSSAWTSDDLGERMMLRLAELAGRAIASYEGRIGRHLRNAVEMGEIPKVSELVDAERGQRVFVVELAGFEVLRCDVLGLVDRPDTPELN